MRQRKVCANSIEKAGPAGLYGLAGCGNATGDDVKKLDLIADDIGSAVDTHVCIYIYIYILLNIIIITTTSYSYYDYLCY